MSKNCILFIVILSATTCFSCKNQTLAKFEIINTTNETIDSFSIIPDNIKNHFIQLEANAKSSYNINMTDFPKVDGCYGLSFKIKNKSVSMPFGYYSNGYPDESLTRIFIHSDTVLIKQEYKYGY